MLLKLYPENPAPRLISQIVETLKNDGVVVLPTDTVYGFVCNLYSTKALGRIAQIKCIKPDKAKFSFLCYSLSQLSDFTAPINNSIFKMMKACLPGPYTFILKANNQVPKIFQNNKKNIGIRIPDNNITLEVIRHLGNPIMSSSVHSDDEIIDYITDPEIIHDTYENLVDIVVDGGFGSIQPSTVIDCSNDKITLVREGKGAIDFLALDD